MQPARKASAELLRKYYYYRRRHYRIQKGPFPSDLTIPYVRMHYSVGTLIT